MRAPAFERGEPKQGKSKEKKGRSRGEQRLNDLRRYARNIIDIGSLITNPTVGAPIVGLRMREADFDPLASRLPRLNLPDIDFGGLFSREPEPKMGRRSAPPAPPTSQQQGQSLPIYPWSYIGTGGPFDPMAGAVGQPEAAAPQRDLIAEALAVFDQSRPSFNDAPFADARRRAEEAAQSAEPVIRGAYGDLRGRLDAGQAEMAQRQAELEAALAAREQQAQQMLAADQAVTARDLSSHGVVGSLGAASSAGQAEQQALMRDAAASRQSALQAVGQAGAQSAEDRAQSANMLEQNSLLRNRRELDQLLAAIGMREGEARAQHEASVQEFMARRAQFESELRRQQEVEAARAAEADAEAQQQQFENTLQIARLLGKDFLRGESGRDRVRRELEASRKRSPGHVRAFENLVSSVDADPKLRTDEQRRAAAMQRLAAAMEGGVNAEGKRVPPLSKQVKNFNVAYLRRLLDMYYQEAEPDLSALMGLLGGQ